MPLKRMGTTEATNRILKNMTQLAPEFLLLSKVVNGVVSDFTTFVATQDVAAPVNLCL